MRRLTTRLAPYFRSRVSDYGLGGHSKSTTEPAHHLNPVHHPEKHDTNLIPGIELPKFKDYNDKYSKHQTLVPLLSGKPWVSVRAFVAPSATIAGQVEIGEHASIWYRCVIRGDSRYVRIGTFVNIQDGTVITEAGRFLSDEHDGSTVIGHYSTIGHNCRITGATIEPCCHVGMGSVLMEGSYMESYSMLGAGSILPEGARVPAFELWVGKPAKFVRRLTDHEKEEIFLTSQAYSLYGQDHAEWIYELKDGEAYKEALEAGLQPGYRKKRWI